MCYTKYRFRKIFDETDIAMKQNIRRAGWVLCLLSIVFSSAEVAAKKQPNKTVQVLWYTQPAEDWMSEALPIGNGRIGAMIFGGVAQEHLQFNDKTLWTGSRTEGGNYQNFGDIYLDFDHGTDCTDYRRKLNIEQAVARTQYRIGKVTYMREYIASFPDDVIAVRLTANKKGQIGFTLQIKDAHTGDWADLGVCAADSRQGQGGAVYHSARG